MKERKNLDSYFFFIIKILNMQIFDEFKIGII